MFEALKPGSRAQTYENLDYIRKVHEQQVEEMQATFMVTRRKLNTNLEELRQQNNQQEFELRDVRSKYENLQMKFDYKVKEEEFFKKEFEIKFKDLETDKNGEISRLSEELGMNYFILRLTQRDHFT